MSRQGERVSGERENHARVRNRSNSKSKASDCFFFSCNREEESRTPASISGARLPPLLACLRDGWMERTDASSAHTHSLTHSHTCSDDRHTHTHSLSILHSFSPQQGCIPSSSFFAASLALLTQAPAPQRQPQQRVTASDRATERASERVSDLLRHIQLTHTQAGRQAIASIERASERQQRQQQQEGRAGCHKTGARADSAKGKAEVGSHADVDHSPADTLTLTLPPDERAPLSQSLLLSDSESGIVCDRQERSRRLACQ